MFFHRHKSQRTLIIKSTGFAVSGVLVVFILAIVGLYITNIGDQSVQGVLVYDTPVDNLSYQQAKHLLQQRTDALLQKDVSFHVQNTTRTASLASTGVYIDIDATLTNAYDYGKNGAFYTRIYQQVQSLLDGKTFPLVVGFNRQLFNEYIENTFQGLYTLPQNAQLRYNIQDKEFKIIDPVEGIIIDTQKLQNDINDNVQRFASDAIYVEQLSRIPPFIKRPQQLIEQAQAIVDKDLMLAIRNDVSIQVPREEMASWAVFTHQENDTLSVEYSTERIKEYLQTIANKYNITPKNMRFAIRNNAVQVLQKSVVGYEVQLEEGVAIIQTALQNNQAQVTIPTTTVPAPINETNVQTLQFTLIGTGRTDYAGSSGNRVHNIKTGSNQYQGIIIAPNEEFSFNDNLGPINAATGYVPELVIKNNQTVPEYGGGLCQVSTTIFRAAVRSGLDITSRRNHSYVVRYYGTPGFDSTIYPPSLDLRFKNNTPGHIMMQYRIEGTNLIFDVYGIDDGRRTVVTGPVPYDVQPSGAMKAWLKQQVFDSNDQPIHEEVFYSTYRSAQDFPVNRNPLE